MKGLTVEVERISQWGIERGIVRSFELTAVPRNLSGSQALSRGPGLRTASLPSLDLLEDAGHVSRAPASLPEISIVVGNFLAVRFEVNQTRMLA